MRTSHRTVTMIGLFMMSISLLGSAYAPSAIYLYPIYGIVYGKYDRKRFTVFDLFLLAITVLIQWSSRLYNT